MREYLKNARQEKNLSQQDVADALNVTRQNYNQIENGERQKDMNISMAQKLAGVFEVSIDYIFENEGKEV